MTKILITILFFFFIQVIVFAQTSEVGKLVTHDGEEIMLHKRPKKKINASSMSKGCDCQVGAKKFKYVNDQGKVSKIDESKIAELNIQAGAAYCQEFSKKMMGGGKFEDVFVLELPVNLKMYGLPVKKKKKITQLHSLLAQNEDYMLTKFTSIDFFNLIYIVKNSDHSLVSGPFQYEEVGYGKQGKKSFTEIKKYFGDCKALVSSMEEIHAKNKKAKRSEKQFVLQNITEDSCN